MTDARVDPVSAPTPVGASRGASEEARLARMARECMLALDPGGPTLEYADGNEFYSDVLWALALLDERTRERDSAVEELARLQRDLDSAFEGRAEAAERALDEARAALRDIEARGSIPAIGGPVRNTVAQIAHEALDALAGGVLEAPRRQMVDVLRERGMLVDDEPDEAHALSDLSDGTCPGGCDYACGPESECWRLQQGDGGAVGWCPTCRVNIAPIPAVFKPEAWPRCHYCNTPLELTIARPSTTDALKAAQPEASTAAVQDFDKRADGRYRSDWPR